MNILTFIGWTLTIVGAVWLAVDILVSWAAHRTRADMLTTPRYQPGYSRDEQIAADPEAVERGLRRSS